VVNLTRALRRRMGAPRHPRQRGGADLHPHALDPALFENPEALAEIERRTPMGRVGEPGIVVGAVLYLASRASALVTATPSPSMAASSRSSPAKSAERQPIRMQPAFSGFPISNARD